MAVSVLILIRMCGVAGWFIASHGNYCIHSVSATKNYIAHVLAILREYTLGDIVARYIVDEKQHIGLQLFPSNMSIPKHIQQRAKLDGMVQLKITGDIYQGSYASGNTLRNCESEERLTFKH